MPPKRKKSWIPPHSAKRKTFATKPPHQKGIHVGEGYYEAREILGENERKYLIAWEGVDPETGEEFEPTWEPKRNANHLLIESWEETRTASRTRRQQRERARNRVPAELELEEAFEAQQEQESRRPLIVKLRLRRPSTKTATPPEEDVESDERPSVKEEPPSDHVVAPVDENVVGSDENPAAADGTATSPEPTEPVEEVAIKSSDSVISDEVAPSLKPVDPEDASSSEDSPSPERTPIVEEHPIRTDEIEITNHDNFEANADQPVDAGTSEDDSLSKSVYLDVAPMNQNEQPIYVLPPSWEPPPSEGEGAIENTPTLDTTQLVHASPKEDTPQSFVLTTPVQTTIAKSTKRKLREDSSEDTLANALRLASVQRTMSSPKETRPRVDFTPQAEKAAAPEKAVVAEKLEKPKERQVLNESQPNLQVSQEKAKEVPAKGKAKEMPPKADEVPPKAREVPPKAEEVPPKAKELPPKAKEVPPKAKEVPAKAKTASPLWGKPKKLPTKVTETEEPRPLSVSSAPPQRTTFADPPPPESLMKPPSDNTDPGTGVARVDSATPVAPSPQPELELVHHRGWTPINQSAIRKSASLSTPTVTTPVTPTVHHRKMPKPLVPAPKPNYTASLPVRAEAPQSYFASKYELVPITQEPSPTKPIPTIQESENRPTDESNPWRPSKAASPEIASHRQSTYAQNVPDRSQQQMHHHTVPKTTSHYSPAHAERGTPAHVERGTPAHVERAPRTNVERGTPSSSSRSTPISRTAQLDSRRPSVPDLPSIIPLIFAPSKEFLAKQRSSHENRRPSSGHERLPPVTELLKRGSPGSMFDRHLPIRYWPVPINDDKNSTTSSAQPEKAPSEPPPRQWPPPHSTEYQQLPPPHPTGHQQQAPPQSYQLVPTVPIYYTDNRPAPPPLVVYKIPKIGDAVQARIPAVIHAIHQYNAATATPQDILDYFVYIFGAGFQAHSGDKILLRITATLETTPCFRRASTDPADMHFIFHPAAFQDATTSSAASTSPSLPNSTRLLAPRDSARALRRLCNICNKSILSRNLAGHMQTHNSLEKPHACKQCSASFRRMADLRRHERSHKVAEYQCCRCRQRFCRTDTLNRHLEVCTMEMPKTGQAGGVAWDGWRGGSARVVERKEERRGAALAAAGGTGVESG